MIKGAKFKRFNVASALMSREYRNVNRAKIKEDSRKYRYFEYTEIPWVIRQQKGNTMILQSEYVLDYQLFDDKDYMDMTEREIGKIRTGIVWESSGIREWLNRDFFQEAFSKEEQERIIVKEIRTPISTFTDKTTYDRVFLPSVEEMINGFDERTGAVRANNSLKLFEEQAPCYFSQFADAKKINESLPMGYGLRTRGTVNEYNGTFTYGESCDGQSIQAGMLKNWRLDVPMGIRPVILVDVTDICEV